MTMPLNAGLRLWQVQQAQGTGLCVGIDLHYGEGTPFDAVFYKRFSSRRSQGSVMIRDLVRIYNRTMTLDADFLVGVYNYFVEVIDAAWDCGIRVYKPQAAFFERLHPVGMDILHLLCKHIDRLAELDFTIFDGKREDIFTSMQAYYDAYLSSRDQVVFAGSTGNYDFDAVTVTMGMGINVLEPGLPFFKNGKGAIVVTRSSNPSGTTFQDVNARPAPWVELSPKQAPHRFTADLLSEVTSLLRRPALTHEVMLYLTEKFSRDHGLNQQGVSPIFSVMGSTVEMSESFRLIRPGGVALVPGWGHQGGGWKKVGSLFVREGPLAGHLGILSASRSMCFAWLSQYGGQGDPRRLRDEMRRAITSFRIAEKQAYANAGVDFPFADHALAPR